MKALFLVIASLAAFVASAYGDVSVRIERQELARPGDRVTLTVGVLEPTGTFQMGGFDITVRYDEHLTLVATNQGQLLNICQWEYFNVTPIGSNELHITSIADISNGAHHPTCYGAAVADIIDITFDIPLDYSLWGRFLPVRFKWYDCADNGISNRFGSVFYMSDDVYFFDGYTEIEVSHDTAFPTYYGAPSTCSSGPGARILDFYNGGVSLIQQDVEPPVAQCPGDTFLNAESSQCGATVDFTATVTDNRPGATINCWPPSGSFFPIGPNGIACIAEDAAGNRDTCFFTIMITDSTGPTLVCPADTTVENSPGACSAFFYYSAIAEDGCGPPTVTASHPSGSLLPLGTTQIIVTATDSAGNATIDSFSVTVVDTEPPEATHPWTMTVSNDQGVCGAEVTYPVSVSDNCPGGTLIIEPPSGSLFPIGTMPVRVIAQDAAENADTTYLWVTVRDDEPPVIIAPDTVYASTQGVECSAAVSYSPQALDNCSAPTVETSIPSGSEFPVGVTKVMVTATDAAGNRDSAWFWVLVLDTEPPEILNPGDVAVESDSGACGASVTYSTTATDNCSEPTIQFIPASGSFFPVGSTQITSIAVDGSGNADTCLFTVSVRDAEPPQITCMGNLAAGSDPGECGATLPITAVANDNCGAVTVITQPPSGSFLPVGPTLVQAIAVDGAGNADTCEFTVTVIDQEPPEVECLVDLYVYNDSGAYTAVVTYDLARYDNCAIAEWGSEPPSGSTFPAGTTEVVVWALDPAGNTDTCRFRVLVQLEDSDADGLLDWEDNCPDDPNPEQADTDSNGVGDACCCYMRGNVNDQGGISVADLTYLVGYLMKGGPMPPCPEQGNVNGIGQNGSGINVADLTYLVNFLFKQGPLPPPCP